MKHTTNGHNNETQVTGWCKQSKIIESYQVAVWLANFTHCCVNLQHFNT